MKWFEKIAVQAFDNEMQRILREEGVDKVMDNKAVDSLISRKPKRTDRYEVGSNVGLVDEYNPTETESAYGQAI